MADDTSAAAAGDCGCDCGGDCAAAAKSRPMNTRIGTWSEDGKVFTTKIDLGDGVKDKDVKIAELGKELNLALANKVNQLEKYRSEFFGKLREALGNRPDVQVVGDRFVVPTDILFATGSAELSPEAQVSMAKLARTLNAVSAEIP